MYGNRGRRRVGGSRCVSNNWGDASGGSAFEDLRTWYWISEVSRAWFDSHGVVFAGTTRVAPAGGDRHAQDEGSRRATCLSVGICSSVDISRVEAGVLAGDEDY